MTGADGREINVGDAVIIVGPGERGTYVASAGTVGGTETGWVELDAGGKYVFQAASLELAPAEGP